MTVAQHQAAHMPKKLLIEVTDERFRTPANAELLDFIRHVNPFCHSDVGSLLIDLGKQHPGTHAYCPSYKDCAYVVLHTDTNRIFAIALGQRGLVIRLPRASHEAAIRDGASHYHEIGDDWLRFDCWPRPPISNHKDRIEHWLAESLAHAQREDVRI